MVRNYFLLIVLFFTTSIYSQVKLEGKVSNEKGESLVGANVFIGNQKGTITDNDGYYFIELTPGNYFFEVSFIGYTTVKEQLSLTGNLIHNFQLQPAAIAGEEIIVYGTRANETTPTTYSVVGQEQLDKKNLGQDMPFLLGMEPSLVFSSDAGTGVGYTSLWIRGSNVQRINVTVNGIPLNDPESHGVFWVNTPDFATSVESVQIQRGVGTSTNGSGAFGATINLETTYVEKDAFGEISSSAGSFNSFKNSARFGTGLINNTWAFEGRLSKITSDGYIDRASSDLTSAFIQGGYFTDKTTVKAVYFTGKEKTYQAWYGADEWTMDNYGRTFNWAGAIENEDGTYSFYNNQTDNYQQDHYQLHLSQKVNKNLNFNTSLHYTYGRGYYEEYNQDDLLEYYPIGNQYFGYDSTFISGNWEYFYHDTITTSDLIVRRWLDNHFYGATFNLNYSADKIEFTLGGGVHLYKNAKHFGEIIWADYAGDISSGDKYYNNKSDKSDINGYFKVNYQPVDPLHLFIDLQVRNVTYTATGVDKDEVLIDLDENFLFFNPKFGFIWDLNNIGQMYSSVAIANREPIRTDYLDAPGGVKPEPERLTDVEVGLRKTSSNFTYNANIYYMYYSNQLALTGEINDVGSPIRANVGTSDRTGLELDATYRVNSAITVRANSSFGTSSTNFKQENDTIISDYGKVQLSFSPQIVSGLELSFVPVKNFEIKSSTRYVSRQYMDLTENNDLSLDPYLVSNLLLSYTLNPEFIQEIRFTFSINNILNAKYSSNGYLWGTTPYYYPQAGINYLAGIQLGF